MAAGLAGATLMPAGRPIGTPQSLEVRARIAAAKRGTRHPAASHEREVEAARRRWSDPAYRAAHAAGRAKRRDVMPDAPQTTTAPLTRRARDEALTVLREEADRLRAIAFSPPTSEMALLAQSNIRRADRLERAAAWMEGSADA